MVTSSSSSATRTWSGASMRRRASSSTVAGTGVAGFSGDDGPAAKAQLRQPHSIAFDSAGQLLVCDIGNSRVRRVDMASGTITTFAGTGERRAAPDEAPLDGTPLQGPRSIDADSDGNAYLVLREGNAVLAIDAKRAPPEAHRRHGPDRILRRRRRGAGRNVQRPEGHRVRARRRSGDRRHREPRHPTRGSRERPSSRRSSATAHAATVRTATRRLVRWPGRTVCAFLAGGCT